MTENEKKQASIKYLAPLFIGGKATFIRSHWLGHRGKETEMFSVEFEAMRFEGDNLILEKVEFLDHTKKYKVIK